MKRSIRWGIGFGAVLTLFTLYVALDTFVIARKGQENATGVNYGLFSGTPTGAASDGGNASGATPGTSDQDGNGSSADTTAAPGVNDSAGIAQNSVTLSEYYINETHVYVADVQLTSAQYLKTAFAKDTYGRNITANTSTIAAAHGALLAINGDYYGAQERGYVIRNGVIYRDRRGSNDVLCIYADGTMEVVGPTEYTAEELLAKGVWHAFSFGPGLIEDGQITVNRYSEVGRAMASNPRTAIGLIDANHFLFVVSDGRTGESDGLTLYELAEFMYGLGARTAYNLDGGGSSTMYYDGKVVNNPTSNGRIRERAVSDIIYIKWD